MDFSLDWEKAGSVMTTTEQLATANLELVHQATRRPIAASRLEPARREQRQRWPPLQA